MTITWSGFWKAVMCEFRKCFPSRTERLKSPAVVEGSMSNQMLLYLLKTNVPEEEINNLIAENLHDEEILLFYHLKPLEGYC